MNERYKLAVVLFLVAISTAPKMFGQVGNDNPTGIAGEFQGEITTACDYSPYTTTARRSVTDLVVAGGVGAYPLAFTRTSTSRYNTAVGVDFGTAGSWLHSYQWSIDTVKTSSSTTNNYTVNYPDGSRVAFSTDPERLNPWGDPYAHVLGVRDRLHVIWDTNSAGRCYLILEDGGQVYFTAQRTFNGTKYTFTFTLQSITDPYGQTTTITGSPTNSPITVTEPAGRWIKMFYRMITSSSEGAVNDVVIDHITASDGRTVQYSYTAYLSPLGTRYTSLTSVVYYGDLTLAAAYTYQNDNMTGEGRPLLSTCFDPMYMGPMVRIAYRYVDGSGNAVNPDGSSVVAGQMLSENYFDGTHVGSAVSTLSILPNGHTYNRQETTGDGRTRKFLVGAFFVFYAGDFKGVFTSQGIDLTYYYVNSFTNRNGNTTNWTNTALTAKPVQITFPLTPNDTPSGTPRGTVTHTYGSATCPDPNNRDANNPYYLYSSTDEGGHTTVFVRDANKRIIQVNYADGGTESFSYNSFGQVLTHGMKTGGTETFTFDTRGLLQTYRDPYHVTGNPSLSYQYDSLDRVSGITDALGSAAGDINHTTNFTYNSRGQLLTTTHPVDPIDGLRHSTSNVYNQPLGTLASVTDELGHLISYMYDDYRRVRSTTTPGHNTPLNSRLFYDPNGTGEDYTHTDANVTYAISPSGKKLITQYNPNKQKTSVTAVAADGVSDKAVTSFGYDNNGNVTSVVSPNEQPGQLYAGKSTTTAYDERNRPMSITDALNNPTSFMYDGAGRKASVARANGQVTTFDSYDAMNRLLQQTVRQTPDPDAVTKWIYYTSGLLHTMQDPRLVANNSNYAYTYSYDVMGRKIGVQYPPDSTGTQTTEGWHYDADGRVDQFTNRATNHQALTYDNLNRLTDTHWNDGGTTPDVHNGYDVASRLTSVTNANATISRVLFNDGLLNSETMIYADNTSRTVSYTYDSDGNRATIQYPNGAYSFTYNYTGRNRLWKLINNSGGATVATFGYDPDGNLTSRTPDNSTSSSLSYDPLDRVTHLSHTLNGTTRTFDYAYDSVGNGKWTKRDGGAGDVFGYDLNDQSISVLLNVANPDTTSPGSQTISYDANGNRMTFSSYGPADSYVTDNNSLNQYHTRNGVSASYDAKGNMTNGFDGSSFTYDAQNRILSAKSNTDAFAYDGLNRQVKRTVAGVGTTYNVYDSWNLIAEYNSGSTSPSKAYLTGAGGLVKELVTNQYYYQDASGSTSHLASNTGSLLEWYRYDLQGTPVFYNASNNQIANTAHGIRHLFTGQQWYSEIGLYDLRNRFYSPDIGRFLQSDPIGFGGDPTNLYRYCGNNPVARTDLLGLYQKAFGIGYGPFFYFTWGFNDGQSNWAFGLGIGTGIFYSYSESGPTYDYGPASVVYSKYDVAIATNKMVSINAQWESIDYSAKTSVTSGPRAGNFSGDAGFGIDDAGHVSREAPTLTVGEAAFAVSGIMSFGSTISNTFASQFSNGAFDAASVEKEMATAANAFQDPSTASNSSSGPFDSVSLSLQNFGSGVTGGIGSFGGGGSFGSGGDFTVGAGVGGGGPGGGGCFDPPCGHVYY